MESAKILYEIYQESGYDGRYRVVYFTELNERNRDIEIGRALAGRHVHDGFIPERGKDAAKERIAAFVARLNAGENPPIALLEKDLAGQDAGP